MSYFRSPVPWAPATPDGLAAKTDKSKLIDILQKDIHFDPPHLEKCARAVDVNALLHSIVGMLENFGGLAEKICSL